MFRCLLGVLFCQLGVMANAQMISLDFKAEGASSHIDEVEAVNLTDGRSIAVFSGEYLLLGGSETNTSSEVQPDIDVTPDIAAGGCDIDLSLTRPGYVFLRITDAMGRVVVDEDRELPRGQYKLQVAALKRGAHKVHLMTPQSEHTHWIMSDMPSTAEKVKVEWLNLNVPIAQNQKSAVALYFAAGDRLLLKGKSGEMVHFMTISPTKDSVLVFHFVPCSDGDKNHYATVEIGGSLWMAENLRTTHLRSGEILPEVSGNTNWRDAAIPAYCWYNSNDHYKYQYGALYNWYAVSDASLCPSGWRMPTDKDWLELEKEIDPAIDVSSATGWRGQDGALKMKALQGWDSQKGSNLFGFSALPAGRRSNEGHFNSMGNYAYWWTLSSTGEEEAWSRYILPDYDYLYRGSFSKNYGLSVRCVFGDD